MNEAEVQELAEALAELESLRKQQPSAFYRPHAGQESFHRSRHDTRIAAAGNRWGKTLAAMVECDWWLQGTHRYQQTPVGTVQVVWVAPTFGQMRKLRDQFESQALTSQWSFNASEHEYTWPNGSTLYIISADSDWKKVQGINPDLVICDEEPPIFLWRELQARRTGYRNNRKVTARYAIVATATESESWMERELYRPWLDHHAKLGLSEPQAMAAQSHPSIWCWPRGGIADNPMADAADVKHYDGINWTSAEEKRVRMGGGFANFAGTRVFDSDGMNWMKTQAEALDADHPGVNGAIRAA